MSQKMWFITGTFKRIWPSLDLVAATARTLEHIADLKSQYGENVLTLALDVTKPDQVQTAVTQAHAHSGGLHVVVNNAGYPLIATIEEASAEDVRAPYETNILGTLSVIQAALPFLREQGHGHIVGISSTLGHVTMPLIGYYCSSKWAFEAIHESLAMEVKPFGIKVTIVEPSAYATEFGGPSSGKSAAALHIYAALRAQVVAGMTTMERGDPKATANAMLKLIDAKIPRYACFSAVIIFRRYGQPMRIGSQTWEEWQSVAEAAQR